MVDQEAEEHDRRDPLREGRALDVPVADDDHQQAEEAPGGQPLEGLGRPRVVVGPEPVHPDQHRVPDERQRDRAYVEALAGRTEDEPGGYPDAGQTGGGQGDPERANGPAHQSPSHPAMILRCISDVPE